MIFDKAETQRKEWQKKLALLKADCLKAQDDPLMAQGLIYRLMTYNSECNTQQCKERVRTIIKNSLCSVGTEIVRSVRYTVV